MTAIMRRPLCTINFNKSQFRIYLEGIVLDIYYGLQMPVTTGGYELPSSYIQYSYLNHWVTRPNRLQGHQTV